MTTDARWLGPCFFDGTKKGERTAPLANQYRANPIWFQTGLDSRLQSPSGFQMARPDFRLQSPPKMLSGRQRRNFSADFSGTPRPLVGAFFFVSLVADERLEWFPKLLFYMEYSGEGGIRTFDIFNTLQRRRVQIVSFSCQ